MTFGMHFFANFETKILFILFKSIGNKIFDFTWIQNQPLKRFFLYATPFKEHKQNFCFKIVKKLHTKHHQIDQKL
jgi:hypothetical protein